jgi:intracellular sulfur oxidation DsrE/DsrF family protein
MKKLLLSLSLLLALAAIVPTTKAAEDNKPFADERIVLQISDSDPQKQTLVLNVASNLIKFYGPDKVDIEIVAFGPGLRLMFKDNVNTGRIQGLTDNGVKFAACKNTIAHMTKLLGEPPELNPNATPVTAGVVRIIELENQGYKLIKP